jgi:hypothetical protein
VGEDAAVNFAEGPPEGYPKGQAKSIFRGQSAAGAMGGTRWGSKARNVTSHATRVM